MKKFLKNPSTHWQWYKDLFQITVFRYLITWFAIVPFLASLLSSLPGELRINILNSEIEYYFNLSLPFSWQLLWLSSLLFVFAFALYRIFCPAYIIKYNSYSDYLAMMHDPRWIVWEAKEILKKKIELDTFFNRLLTKKFIDEISSSEFESKKAAYMKKAKPGSQSFENFGVVVEEKQTVLYFIYEGKAYSLGMPRLNENNDVDHSATELVVKGLFWEVFGRYSASYPGIRLSIMILLVMSGLFFLVVLLQNILNGIQYVL